MDQSIENLVEIIFSTGPKDKNSINLVLESYDSIYLFEVLMNIFVEGMIYKKYLNLENENIIKLNEFEISQLKKYFNSFNYNINIKKKYYNKVIDEEVFNKSIKNTFDFENRIYEIKLFKYNDKIKYTFLLNQLHKNVQMKLNNRVNKSNISNLHAILFNKNIMYVINFNKMN